MRLLNSLRAGLGIEGGASPSTWSVSRQVSSCTHIYSLELAFFTLAFDENSLESLGLIDRLCAWPRTLRALVDIHIM